MDGVIANSKRKPAPVNARHLLAAITATCLGAFPAQAEQGPLAKALGAPDELTITASMRSRVEAIDGQFRPSRPEKDEMFSLKTTLAAEYDAGRVRFGGEIWDARTYGQDRNSSAGATEVNALELIQAYVRYELGDQSKGAKGGKGMITAGRFTFDVGSRRFISRQNFRNTTNAFTGLHADWTNAKGYRLQAFWTMPQIRLPEDANGIRDDGVEWDQETTNLQFYGAHLTVPKVLEGVAELYGYRLAEKDSAGRPTRNRRLWTTGARLFRKPAKGQWDHDIEGAYQFGDVRATTAITDRRDLDVSAWFVHGELGYRFATPWQPRVAFQMDAVSGDKGKAGKFSRFDTLYGARRWEFGPTSLYGPLGRANIVSPGLRLELIPSKRSDAFIMARALWAESAKDSFSQTGVRDSKGLSGRRAGYQVEGRFRYWLIPGRIQADVGAATLFKQGLLNDAPNAPRTGNTHYGYFDLTFLI